MKNQFRIFCFIIVSIFTMNSYSQSDITTLKIIDVTAESGSQFSAPVIVLGNTELEFQNPNGFSLHIKFDSTVIEFVSIDSNEINLTNANVLQAYPGIISIVWIYRAGDYSAPLSAGTELFTLTFNAVGSDGTSTSITTINEMPSVSSPFNREGNYLSFDLNSINITGTLGGKDVNVKSKKIFPNPTSEFIDISNYQVTEDYEIYNATGQKILNGSLEASGRVNVQNLQSGTYFLKLESGSAYKFIKE